MASLWKPFLLRLMLVATRPEAATGSKPRLMTTFKPPRKTSTPSTRCA